MLSSGIMQRAFVETIVLGLACGPLGVWILLLRRSYAAESLSHAMLPGLVLAALIGAPLVLGAAGGVLFAAAGIALVGGEIGVAVVVSALFGLGGILALSPKTPPRISPSSKISPREKMLPEKQQRQRMIDDSRRYRSGDAA